MMEILLNNLDQKSLVNLADKNGLNPLLYAVKTENIQVLRVILEQKSLNLDFQDKVYDLLSLCLSMNAHDIYL